MCNYFNFDFHPSGQGCHLDRAARWWSGSEESAVNLIHGSEFTQVSHKNRRLDHTGSIQALIVEDDLDVIQDLPGLGSNILANDRSCGRVQWNLTGQEEQVAAADSVAVGAQRLRSVLGLDDGFGGHAVRS